MKLISVLLLIVACVGCRDSESSFEKAMEHPGHPEESKLLSTATVAFLKLHDQGKLPGFARDELGNVDSLPFQSGSSNTAYPQSITIRVQKEDDKNGNLFYSMKKDTAASNWALVQAWREDKATGEKKDLLKPN